MSECTIPLDQVDPSILGRISEDDVSRWLAAKMASLCAGSLSLSALTLHVWHRQWRRADPVSFDVDFSLYGAGETSGDHESIAGALAALRERVLGHPSETASRKKEEARRLLDEAAVLDRLAAAESEVPA